MVEEARQQTVKGTRSRTSVPTSGNDEKRRVPREKQAPRSQQRDRLRGRDARRVPSKTQRLTKFTTLSQAPLMLGMVYLYSNSMRLHPVCKPDKASITPSYHTPKL